MNKVNPFYEKNAISVGEFCSANNYRPKPYDKNKHHLGQKHELFFLTAQSLSKLGFCTNSTETATTMI